MSVHGPRWASLSSSAIHRSFKASASASWHGCRPLTSEAVSINENERTTAVANRRQVQRWLFIDSLFPIRIARWDLRHYIGLFREERILSVLRSRLESIHLRQFKIFSFQPHEKDGGVFVSFNYTVNDSETSLQSIEDELNREATRQGGLPSWYGVHGGRMWVVRGTPWTEVELSILRMIYDTHADDLLLDDWKDMSRFASPIVKVEFEGPDVDEQTLYQIFRSYGHIKDISRPVPVPAGTLRSSTITFSRLYSATVARNVINGLRLQSHKPCSAETKEVAKSTVLHTSYEVPIQAHVIRNWMSNHPRIILPMLVFLLGTVFDPLRSLMVQGKMLNWFNYREFKLYKWLQMNAWEGSYDGGASISPELSAEDIWKEREDAVKAIRAYLTDLPSTVAFIHGPQGSGKTRMIQAILKDSGRTSMIIDCRELYKSSSDAQVVAGLARQTGYWPVFSFLQSMNNMIDLASVGIIGQKAGLSSSLSDQILQLLNVVGTALKGVSAVHQHATQRQMVQEERAERGKLDEDRRRQEIILGTWHDPRLDCVAGNGVMSELGVGDEHYGDIEEMSVSTGLIGAPVVKESDTTLRQRAQQESKTIASLPIVVIRNYSTQFGSGREELLTVLAHWAAALVENQIAHVIVVSDNRENSKQLTQALRSKPLNSISLSDADPKSSLSLVKQRLEETGNCVDLTERQIMQIERLGGRASDLESLIHKVRSGQTIESAVEDIITRGIAEIRKNAFGDDAEDAKNLPWSRGQAWTIMKRLAQHGEIPYYEVLLDYPFKGDEMSLRGMEHAELISINAIDGRATSIKPGRPVLRWIFERIVNDPIFQAAQGIAYNQQAIASFEKAIKAYEDELVVLRNLEEMEHRPWWTFGLGGGSTGLRTRYLLDKLRKAERKIEELERQNASLQKTVASGQ